jgi:hypothetical protein
VQFRSRVTCVSRLTASVFSASVMIDVTAMSTRAFSQICCAKLKCCLPLPSMKNLKQSSRRSGDSPRQVAWWAFRQTTLPELRSGRAAAVLRTGTTTAMPSLITPARQLVRRRSLVIASPARTAIVMAVVYAIIVAGKEHAGTTDDGWRSQAVASWLSLRPHWRGRP